MLPDPVPAVLAWYASAARDLPWRAEGTTPWGVLVSEVMLQQTPVVRVLGPWREWLDRWPTPRDLAAVEPGDAVRAWGRLGYPRRALRLHAAARLITEQHDGEVPSDLTALRALPGVGEYTAAAVASFGFGQRHTVIDVNVARVLTRYTHDAEPASPAVLRRRAGELVPDSPALAAAWAAASMELGAMVCTASSPSCQSCPVSHGCRWLAAGRPELPRSGRPQAWHGTDRQCRGRLLAVLREATHPVPGAVLLAAWPQNVDQAERALRGLVGDTLVHLGRDGYHL